MNGWEQAGIAWGARATEWAYLHEPQTRPVYEAVLDACGVTRGTALLDDACGSGYAAALAAGRGAHVSGLDASERLLDIARLRTPDGDFRRGDFETLPWPDASFDVVTGFMAFFPHVPDALAEARRVLRPHGRLAFTFLDRPWETDIFGFMMVLSDLGSPSTTPLEVTLRFFEEDGIESFAREAGLEPLTREVVDFVQEFPDLDAAYRAFATAGPPWDAIRHSGEQRFRDAVLEAFGPYDTATNGVRLRHRFGYLVTRPA